MTDWIPEILQVNTWDNRGGAATVAWNLHLAFRKGGLKSRMAVGFKSTSDSDIFVIKNEEFRRWHSRILLKYEDKIRASGAVSSTATRIRKALFWAGNPDRAWEEFRGLEYFSYPGTWRMIELAGFSPSIIHCHNLHSGYFDLRALPWLSSIVPVIITLHDAWLLSGHCAHSFTCSRWKSGCGACPDLNIPPPIYKDGTAASWKRKKRIFERSNLHIVTPCQWMMDLVEQSILAPAIRGARVIPNGVDLDVFYPQDKNQARLALDLPMSTKILCFVAENTQSNPFKDWNTLVAALELIADRGANRDLIFLAVGGDKATHCIGSIEVRSVPYTTNSRQLALYYQASDIYIHAARAETFPLVILEAMACGIPVIASRVGGIPEIIQDNKTGLLVNPGNVAELARSIEILLSEPERSATYGANAARDVRDRFGLERHIAMYLDFYREARANFLQRNQPHAKMC